MKRYWDGDVYRENKYIFIIKGMSPALNLMKRRKL